MIRNHRTVTEELSKLTVSTESCLHIKGEWLFPNDVRGQWGVSKCLPCYSRMDWFDWMGTLRLALCCFTVGFFLHRWGKMTLCPSAQSTNVRGPWKPRKRSFTFRETLALICRGNSWNIAHGWCAALSIVLQLGVEEVIILPFWDIQNFT